jgi:hypothetical protein
MLRVTNTYTNGVAFESWTSDVSGQNGEAQRTMTLNLAKTVVDFLSGRPEQKFTARKMAEWIFDNHPAECQEKKANSTYIKTDAELIQQVVAEIGSQRPALQKKKPQIKTTESRPRQYYWTEKSDHAEITEAEEAETPTNIATGDGSHKESDLYPCLSKYFGRWTEFTRSG